MKKHFVEVIDSGTYPTVLIKLHAGRECAEIFLDIAVAFALANSLQDTLCSFMKSKYWIDQGVVELD